MRLKRLDIKGFKSFANQTVVNFDADVIGIVGPNGSGKSNIVDAIRWVLGEQKGKELRLDKMASVIFNGTRKKKAGNLASVSLTFANDKGLLPTEYGEVSITRMLYRSGDSEYRLNGVSCRLKDIRNLFMDTGIGSNSYAIIALGMVDDILADKDNSRRRMFEQAAGIGKYKTRKKETLRKLKNTEEDLDRIEDLLHEIEGNLKSLEKQAKRARKYRDLKEQYRGLSLLLTGIRLEKLRIEQRDVEQATEQAVAIYRNTEERVTELEAKLLKLREVHSDKERQVGERQRKLNALVGELRGLENERQLLRQRGTFVVRQQEQLRRDIERSNEQLATYDDEVGLLAERLATEGEQLAERKAGKQSAEAALEAVRKRHGGLKDDLDTGLRQQQQQERRIFELDKQRAINGSQAENFRLQIERNQGEMQQRRAESEGLRARLAELQKKESELQNTLAELHAKEAARRGAIAAAETDIDRLRTELSRINRGLDARRNERKLIKSMIDSLEGYPDSIRFLSKHKQWVDSPRLLSDLILVDADYRTALENYLEPYLNYYVVDNLEQARAGLNLLEAERKGRANFFLLDRIDKSFNASDLGPQFRSALEVVTVDEAYRPLVQMLLGNVFIGDTDKADGVDGAVVLNKAGTYVRRPHSVGGGSVGLFEGKKIGRKKNLEVLTATIAEAEKKATASQRMLEVEKQKLGELRQQNVDRDIQRQQRELGDLQRQQAGMQAKDEGLTAYFDATQTKNRQLVQQAADLNRQNEGIETELKKLRTAIDTLRSEVTGTDEAYRQLSEELSSVSTRYNEENVRYIQQQNLLRNLEQEKTFKENRKSELTTQRAVNEGELASLDREARDFGKRETEMARNLEVMQADKKKYQSTLSGAEKSYVEARTQINQCDDELRKESRQRQDAQVKVNHLKEKQTELRFKLEGIAERLRIEFSLTLNELAQTEVEEWTASVGELEVKVDRLRSRIGNYGEINPLAIEAFEEMQERHTTITQQRDDIVEAKTTLLKTIKEIEDTATVQFLEAFDRVRLFFIDVFRSLFTEDDNCDLILLEPDQPLESGIEIVAKPKGKKPQTISQLSGGEKTLTATALLFALYLLKPAPFCIFDEVDAPLDDANIYKFNRIIKKFSRESQFIIVTHNKLTMEAVDSIYGVYTTEQGGSGVLPVQFTELSGSTAFSAV